MRRTPRLLARRSTGLVLADEVQVEVYAKLLNMTTRGDMVDNKYYAAEPLIQDVAKAIIEQVWMETGLSRMSIEMINETEIVITFNAAVEPTSFTYTIAEEGAGAAPAVTAAWNAPDYTAVTLTPQTALAAGTIYTVSGIGATPADTLAYEALSGGEFSFTTAIADGAPAVEITSPAAGVTVSGLMQVGVAAQPGSGDTQIQRIEVEFGDQAQVLEAASGTVTFNSCYAINGEQPISAVAIDSAGVRSECVSVAVVVDNFAFYVDERVQVVAADAPGGSVTVPVRITDAAGNPIRGPSPVKPEAPPPPVAPYEPPSGERMDLRWFGGWVHPAIAEERARKAAEHRARMADEYRFLDEWSRRFPAAW